MSTPLALSMQISASTSSLAASVRDVNARLESMGSAAKQASADMGVLKSIELSRVFLSALTTAASSFQGLVGGAASAVAAVDDLSQRTGASTQALQAYQFAADQSGVGIETFGKSLQKLSVNLGEAQTGNSSAISAFRDLGLSVQELSALQPELAFEKVAAAISMLPNPAQQAAAAVSLFGKSGVDLVPVFAQGAEYLMQMREEAESLGLVLSTQQVSSLAGLDDSIAKVSASFGGLTARVVAEFAPALAATADELSKFLGSLDARDIVGNLSASLGNLSEVSAALGSAFQLVSSVFTPLAEVIFPVVAQTLGFLAANIEGAALGALLAAGAYAGYSLAAVTATGATLAFTSALRLLLASTGVGLLVVILGAAAGAFAEWALAGNDATADVSASIAENNARIEELRANLQGAGVDAADFGNELKVAFKVPVDVTNATLTQQVADEAGQAFKKVAEEFGSVDLVPQELIDAWELLKYDIESANDGAADAALAQKLIAESAARVLELSQKTNDARREEKARIDDVVDGVRKAQEYEKRLKEEQLQRVDEITRRELDAQAEIEQRVAEVEAQRLNGLRLRNNEPLKAADIRSSEGIGQFLALATGREDPAVAESRKQTNELQAMNRKLEELAAQKTEIMGGA